MRWFARLRSELRSSDWSFYGFTYASILFSFAAGGAVAMYLIGPPDDAATLHGMKRRPNVLERDTNFFKK